MEISFETYYDHAALRAMSKALRKTMRKRKSMFMRVISLAFIAFAVYRALPINGREFSTSPSALVSYLALIMLFTAVFFEDTINGLAAQGKHIHKGDEIDAIFRETEYELRSDDGITFWQYRSITHVAETRYFFVFVFDSNHAQVFDKDSIVGATVDDFRDFIEKKTGTTVKRV